MTPKSLGIPPSARRLSSSLRDVGYSFESAVADLVDNSIMAGATQIDIEIVFAGEDSQVQIADNGRGMSSDELNEAMRFGSRREYSGGDLGRYGLGLKTASLSQCRRVEVYSKTEGSALEARSLDLDFIAAVDEWLIGDISDSAADLPLSSDMKSDHGTLVVWRRLDRILPAKSPNGGWARRRIESLPGKLRPYLSMVFHRFLSGEAKDLQIHVNGEPLKPWDPFARSEPETESLPDDQFEVEQMEGSGLVTLRRYLLPTRQKFSSSAAYENYSGPEKWNRQQGLYIYRADRLVQWGGWAGIRTADEHTKFARASIDFGTELDGAFNINVAKMRVTLPSELRKMIARPINELCMTADSEYRKSENGPRKQSQEASSNSPFATDSETGETIGLTLRAAAVRTGNLAALEEMMGLISQEMPELSRHLGFE